MGKVIKKRIVIDRSNDIILEQHVKNCSDCIANQRKVEFIKKLARYLAGNQAQKSIELQMGKDSAKEWAELRSTTPLVGYPTVEEAEHVLTHFLA